MGGVSLPSPRSPFPVFSAQWVCLLGSQVAGVLSLTLCSQAQVWWGQKVS